MKKSPSKKTREKEISEVKLLNVPMAIVFPPDHLRAKKLAAPGEPYKEHLLVSVWMKYVSHDDFIESNWDWVPLEQWLEEQDGKEFAVDGTLEELRDLITARALKEPFDHGLQVTEIKVEVIRNTEGVHNLRHPPTVKPTEIKDEVRLNTDSVCNPCHPPAVKPQDLETADEKEEDAVIGHTLAYPSKKLWAFDRRPSDPRGKYCPRPFAAPR